MQSLPLEYSTGELPTPRIRVTNYAPTSVPFKLKKAYGISGKLADAKQGVTLSVYKDQQLVQSFESGSYGYFQVFGLPAATYTLTAEGYQSQQITINDDFVMQVVLQPKD